MKRSALFAVVIALPAIAAAQDTTDRTASIKPASPVRVLTENQARDRLTSAGYTAIGSITRDADGIWRTTAMKGADMMSIGINRDGSIEDR